MNVKDYFPRGYEPREGQLEIIKEIYEAMKSDYHYICLEAGTGTGKSFIAATLANMAENSYIVTSTKQLQAQYERDFGYALVKGRNNFYCHQNNASCDKGYCLSVSEADKWKCEFGFGGNKQCEYVEQKYEAMNSKTVLMNYMYFLTELNYARSFGDRELAIFDEAHNLEKWVMKFYGLNLNFGRIFRTLDYVIPERMKEVDDVHIWVNELNYLIGLYEDLDFEYLSKKEADNAKAMLRNLERVKNNLKNDKENWVVNKTSKAVEFKPVTIKDYTMDTVFDKSDFKLFMSATILDSALFCKWLGIEDLDDIYTVKVESPFKLENRPIKLDLAGKMTYKAKRHSMPASLSIISNILLKHQNEKGVIHTNSYSFTKYLFENINSNRLVVHDNKNRESVINAFKDSEEPLVLLSPSITEGVDLPYDECRFQVIYKVPYPNLADKQVNKRNKLNREWYDYQTVLNFVQAYGRGMRAADDFCVTYVVDSSFLRLRNSRFMPLSVNKAVKDGQRLLM